MTNSSMVMVYLILSGLLLTVIGAPFLFMPEKMKSRQGIEISGDSSALNEIRGSSALILAVAILTILGIFIPSLTYSSVLFSALLFFSLGAGRLMSLILDGMPVKALIIATFVELILGIYGAVIFYIYI